MYKLFFMTSPIYCLIHSHRLETGQTFDLLLTRLSTLPFLDVLDSNTWQNSYANHSVGDERIKALFNP